MGYVCNYFIFCILFLISPCFYLFHSISIYFNLFLFITFYPCILKGLLISKKLILNRCFTYLRLANPDNYEKETSRFITDIRYIAKYELFFE